MKQMTFSDVEYSGRKKVTQKEKFLSMMEQIIPWAEWIGKIQPYYPSGKRGRPPRGIEVMWDGGRFLVPPPIVPVTGSSRGSEERNRG